MPLSALAVWPRNLACHNLLTNLFLPSGTKSLLGLRLNFCIATRTINTTSETFFRLRGDVCHMCTLEHLTDNEDDGFYIPTLYIKYNYKLLPVPDNIKDALNKF